MKYLLIIITIIAYLFLQHYMTAEYNAHMCAVYGKQADCITPLGKGDR